MRTFSKEELNKILENHKHWVAEDIDGWIEMKADLCGANLYRAKNIPYIPLNCPSDGSFIGWKSAIAETKLGNYKCVIKLQIFEDSKRSSATTNKCRCDKAKVLDIELLNDMNEEIIQAHSGYDNSFIYKVGKIVSVDNFNEDRWNECAPGIHFFIDKQEAIDY